MRQLTSHKGNALNDAITIAVLDEPNHEYEVCFSSNMMDNCIIGFQKGPPAESINGLSNEVLLAIVEDRLAGFQEGPFKCRENAIALTKIQEALMWLQKRTRDRAARGVEGTQAA